MTVGRNRPGALNGKEGRSSGLEKSWEGTDVPEDDSSRGGQSIVQLKNEDMFWLTDLYPEPKALFHHKQASLDEIIQECIVVLDANVLLWPYEFNSASMKEVEKVYAKLAQEGRLVVPGQSAREFYKHRSRKVATITDAIEGAIAKAKAQVFDKSIPLLEDDKDYQAAREAAKNVIEAGKTIVLHLSRVNERLKEEIGTDRISTSYRSLLADSVVDIDCSTMECRATLIDEMKRRSRLQIAPGYKDKAKEDGGIGDFIIWKTVLQEGERRAVHCIFVTNEEKPDWWIRSRGAFQPRPELLEEYRRASGGKSIHLLPLSGLLATFKAEESVVQEVQTLEEAKRARVSMSDIDAHYSQLVHDKRSTEDELNSLQQRYREIVYKLATMDAHTAEIEQGINADLLPGRRAELLAELGSLQSGRASLVAQVELTLRMIDERRAFLTFAQSQIEELDRRYHEGRV